MLKNRLAALVVWPLGALWALLISAALRHGESMGLTWQDYGGESITVTSQITLENGKIVRGDLNTDKSKRRLRLPDVLIRELEVHREMQHVVAQKDGKKPPELMFATSRGGPILPSNLLPSFIRACKKAGITPHQDGRPWTIHELRHIAANQLLNDRVPMQIVHGPFGAAR